MDCKCTARCRVVGRRSVTLTHWLIKVYFWSYILHVGGAFTKGAGGLRLESGGKRAVLDQRKAVLLPWRHQSVLLARNHTRLLSYAKCVRACAILLCLVTVTPVSSANFIRVLNISV